MEIGVRYGVSTSALLAGIEDHGGKLFSVDIDDCPVFLGHPNWIFFRADTQKAFGELQGVVPPKLDLLFVDGDHTYQGALRDLENFGGRAKRILVHDTDAPDFPGVRKAVEDYVHATGRKVTWHPGSFGMAEIA